MQKLRQHPILILLIINIVVGLFTFRDYGLSWDEPLFYDYANALGYAYTPSEWFSRNFDLENAYGASGTDHANRGPAYILPVSYTHLRAHETVLDLVCRLLLEKKTIIITSLRRAIDT